MNKKVICTGATDCQYYSCYHRQPHERVDECHPDDCGEFMKKVKCVIAKPEMTLDKSK